MPSIYLASGSAARRRLLDSAGISYEAKRPNCDEEALKQKLEQKHTQFLDSAKSLAFEKAKSVSLIHEKSLCLGGDQICTVSDKWLSKPTSLGEVFDQLSEVSGKEVAYVTALSLCEDGQEVWSYVETIYVLYRSLSSEQKNWYLGQRSDASFRQEGLMLVEGSGIQLVANIRGSFSGLLGLPLLPLISELQRRHILEY